MGYQQYESAQMKVNGLFNAVAEDTLVLERSRAKDIVEDKTFPSFNFDSKYPSQGKTDLEYGDVKKIVNEIIKRSADEWKEAAKRLEDRISGRSRRVVS